MTAVGGNTPYAKDGATWKAWDDFYANDGGTWKAATNVYINDNGIWKEVWNRVPLVTSASASDTTATPSFTQVAATDYGVGNATLGITSGVTGSYSEIFYLYRKSGATTYTESTSQSLTGLEAGGTTAVTYFHKAVGYNGNRQVTVSGSINNNGFYVSSIKVQYGNSTSLGSEVEVTVPAPDGAGVHSFSRAITLPVLARGATDTYSTFYYRIVSTNASGTTTSSINSISPQVKYSPSNYNTINTGELSFTNYRSRVDIYSTPGTYTWTAPTPPVGGVSITRASFEVIGGGGGGGKAGGTIPSYAIHTGGISPRYGGAAGGGAGGYNSVNLSVSPGVQVRIVVGAKGRGGLRDGNTSRNGESGGRSYVQALPDGPEYNAYGGGGGQSSENYASPMGGSSGSSIWGYRGGGGGAWRYNSNLNDEDVSIGGGGAGNNFNGGSATYTRAGDGGNGQYEPIGGGGGGAGAYVFYDSGYGDYFHRTVTGVGGLGGGPGVIFSTNLSAADATGVGGGGGGVGDYRTNTDIAVFPLVGTPLACGGNGADGRVSVYYTGP